MRRRKPKVVWLPSTNTFSVDTANRRTWSIASVALSSTPGGPGAVIEVPIVMDGNTSDPLGATSSLSDIESSGYRLRRIVGKLYAFIGQTLHTADEEATEEIYGVTAGFIIRRADPSTGASLAVAAGAPFNDINPADIDNSMDPWIWRRSWLLSNYFDADSGAATALSDTVASTLAHAGGGANYGRGYPGGNAEGPHVDQKTARIVGPEERLFLDVSATPIISNAGHDTALVIVYDLRCLASMRSNIGNRRNASR